LCGILESVGEFSKQTMQKEEEEMNKWRLWEGPLTRLNAVLDEILQMAVYAHQVVPWLFSGPSRRTY
jgi:hypothetical protein